MPTSTLAGGDTTNLDMKGVRASETASNAGSAYYSCNYHKPLYALHHVWLHICFAKIVLVPR